MSSVVVGTGGEVLGHAVLVQVIRLLHVLGQRQRLLAPAALGPGAGAAEAQDGRAGPERGAQERGKQQRAERGGHASAGAWRGSVSQGGA
eukprot:CAMPEP_0168415796 /NCGR_PEP_ID=MMETSP0228-20121227/30416_1 /TAXON_ID=133427 /ORGANISM="Protoceratium reticulatum, Strain CCCM 535 (=CCMP 1889)" /LENGTH=89 /DNA_ID=CAMNT_0008429615 /DNA_START=80 /DNA_END=348 /DNA_ORIENTATION=-